MRLAAGPPGVVETNAKLTIELLSPDVCFGSKSDIAAELAR
jgi:hypothetical protein